MTNLHPVCSLLSKAPQTTYDVVILGYDAHFLRRKRLVTAQGEGFLVDLPNVTNLDDHWGFQLEDGRAIQIIAAEDALVEITGPDLHRLAWHIGNRHTPCQIESHRLLIRRDHVLEAMLAQLGASVSNVTEPFTPEGGAYGTGRTMGHDHGGHDHVEQDHVAQDHGSTGHGTKAATEASPEPQPHAQDETFGWHDHGDGKLHFHATKR